MTGSQLVAELLAGYGVTHVFHVPTILFNSLYEMEQRTTISRILAHSEKAAAYMADGYARASGRPGICMAQMAGAANLAAGLRDAYLGSSPVIAVTGGPYPYSRDRHQYQQVGDQPMFLPVTKASTRIDALDRLPATLRQAFRDATTGRPGPVHLELEGSTGSVLETQEGELDPTPEPRFGKLPPFRPTPDEDDISRATDLLVTASKPVIVAGGGVKYSGAGSQLVSLADQLSIPVAVSLSAKDVIPADHPLNVGVVGLYSRASANSVVSAADLIFFIGTKTGSQVTHSWRVPALGTRIIQSDIAGDVMGLNYPNDASLVGDARSTLNALIQATRKQDLPPDRTDWARLAASAVTEWRTEYQSLLHSNATPIRPERLCSEISRTLPDDGVIVADTGHAGMWAASMIDLHSPNQGFIRASGSLGWAFPAAIGAQCALPDRPVVAFTGDGGLYYHIAELETMARHGIPATVIVNNNSSLNQEQGLLSKAYQGEVRGRHYELWKFREVDFAEVASQMGVPAERVEKPDDLAGVLSKAISAGTPYLVDVVTDISAMAPEGFLPT